VIDSGRGAVRAEDAQGTPTQSHISPSILVYEEKTSAANAGDVAYGMGCGPALGLLHETRSLSCHLPPEVNYLPCFENDGLPCMVKFQTLPCRVNHHSRNRVNSSLLADGGWREPPWRQPRGKKIVSLVNSHTNAASKR